MSRKGVRYRTEWVKPRGLPWQICIQDKEVSGPSGKDTGVCVLPHTPTGDLQPEGRRLCTDPVVTRDGIHNGKRFLLAPHILE